MFLPLIIVLILAALWSAYWFIAITFAQSEAARQRQALAQRGLTLACTQESWGGFPFRFEFTCQTPVLTVADRAEAASSRLLLVALAYNPWQVVALLDGPTTVTAAGILPRKAEHQRVVAAVTLAKDNAVSVSAEVPGIAVEGLAKADTVMVHTRPSENGLADIAVSVAGFNFQPQGRPPLEIDTAAVRATADSALNLKVDSVELQRGSVRYWGSGSVALDAERRISGQLATETNDLNGLLTLLEPHLDMTDDEKANLRAMLGLLGNEAKAPIIAKDGNLLLGPFKIADLLPLY